MAMCKRKKKKKLEFVRKETFFSGTVYHQEKLKIVTVFNEVF